MSESVLKDWFCGNEQLTTLCHPLVEWSLYRDELFVDRSSMNNYLIETILVVVDTSSSVLFMDEMDTQQRQL